MINLTTFSYPFECVSAFPDSNFFVTEGDEIIKGCNASEVETLLHDLPRLCGRLFQTPHHMFGQMFMLWRLKFILWPIIVIQHV